MEAINNNSSMSFQKIVIIIAIIILIIILTVIGYMMYSAKMTTPLGTINKCPDKWTFDGASGMCVASSDCYTPPYAASCNVGKLLLNDKSYSTELTTGSEKNAKYGKQLMYEPNSFKSGVWIQNPSNPKKYMTKTKSYLSQINVLSMINPNYEVPYYWSDEMCLNKWISSSDDIYWIKRGDITSVREASSASEFVLGVTNKILKTKVKNNPRLGGTSTVVFWSLVSNNWIQGTGNTNFIAGPFTSCEENAPGSGGLYTHFYHKYTGASKVIDNMIDKTTPNGELYGYSTDPSNENNTGDAAVKSGYWVKATETNQVSDPTIILGNFYLLADVPANNVVDGTGWFSTGLTYLPSYKPDASIEANRAWAQTYGIAWDGLN